MFGLSKNSKPKTNKEKHPKPGADLGFENGGGAQGGVIGVLA